VREQIIAFAERHDVAEGELVDFLCAVGEAVANAIEHARAVDPIEVNIWLVGDDQLIAVIVDHGIGFQPTASAVTEPALPDELAERGRGLPIMRTCSDLFAVQSQPGRGTTVTLGQRLRNRRAHCFQAAG
jgi:anti-sigma regulatory factor (Ser/Thr protein kinase)